MKPRIVFIHGNGTTHWSFAWTPWLKENLEQLGFPTFFETFPDSIIARRKYWLPFLHDHVKAGPADVLVGWSSGAVAAMRYAEANKINGSVLISPCYTDLGIESEKESGYYDDPWNWDAIRSNQKEIALVCSDNDPFIPQKEFEFIIEKLKPQTIKVLGAGHFIERGEIPELLTYLKKTYQS